MAGYGVSNVAICARMRELGIPDTLAKAQIGRMWSFYDPRRWSDIAFFLNHNEQVPISLWMRMNSEQRQQFSQHQWPDDT